MRRTIRNTIAAAAAIAALAGAVSAGTSTASAATGDPVGRTQLVFQLSPVHWGSVARPTTPGATVYYDHYATTEAATARTAPYWDVIPTSAGWSRLQLNGSCLGTGAMQMLQPTACDGSPGQEWRRTVDGLERRSNGATYGKLTFVYQMSPDPKAHVGVYLNTSGGMGGDDGGLRPAAVALTSPAIGEELTEVRPLFSGTGHVGATVTVADTQGTLGTATVDADGRWETRANRPLTPGYHEGTVTQVANGFRTTADFRFVLASLAG